MVVERRGSSLYMKKPPKAKFISSVVKWRPDTMVSFD